MMEADEAEFVVELEMGAISNDDPIGNSSPAKVIERLSNAQSADEAQECLTALSTFLDSPELVKEGAIQQAAVIRAANAAKKTIGEEWAEEEYRALLYKFAESADEGTKKEAIRKEKERREDHPERNAWKPTGGHNKGGNPLDRLANSQQSGNCCLRCCTNCLFLFVLIASIIWGVQFSGLIMPSKYGFPASPAPGCIEVPGKGASGIQTGAQTNLFCAGDAGYGCYKIPSLLSVPANPSVLSAKGALLAFVEARKYSCADEGYIDIRLRRSLDHGNSWEKSQLVVTMSTEDEWVTVGDPCPVYDQFSSTIHVVFTVDNTDVFVTESSDIGITWSKPINITAEAKLTPQLVQKLADHMRDSGSLDSAGSAHHPHPPLDPLRKHVTHVGTGHAGGVAFMLADKQRLLVPAYCMDCGMLGASKSYVLLSDDGGATWFIGGVLDAGGEAQVAVVKSAREGQTPRLVMSLRSSLGHRLQVRPQ
jgi:hypothetical protein